MNSMAEKYIAWFASKKEGRSSLAVFLISWVQCVLVIVFGGAALLLAMFWAGFVIFAPMLLGNWGIVIWVIGTGALVPFISLMNTKGAGDE